MVANIVRDHAGRLLDFATAMVSRTDPPVKSRSRSMLVPIAGAALTQLARRSVPGAIVLGGAFLAKRLYDRRHKQDSD